MYFAYTRCFIDFGINKTRIGQMFSYSLYSMAVLLNVASRWILGTSSVTTTPETTSTWWESLKAWWFCTCPPPQETQMYLDWKSVLVILAVVVVVVTVVVLEVYRRSIGIPPQPSV